VGQGLLVVIDTQNRALGFHQPSASIGATGRGGSQNQQKIFSI
jgi:hypothetical protein